MKYLKCDNIIYKLILKVLTGIERQQFSIHHSFDGFMLKTLTAGASPITSLYELVSQVSNLNSFSLIN